MKAFRNRAQQQDNVGNNSDTRPNASKRLPSKCSNILAVLDKVSGENQWL